jgi:hypothetical protein
MSQRHAGRRTPFACGHRGLGKSCRRCLAADFYRRLFGENAVSYDLLSTGRGPDPLALTVLKAERFTQKVRS